MTAIATDPKIETGEASRAKRLKALTSDAHGSVDRSIMSAPSFASRERYARFLAVQYLFRRDIEALYDNAALQALFPDLATRQRLPLAQADLADLALEAPVADAPPPFVAGAVDVPKALGWLYVAEGSNMGAAILPKEAAKIGLSDSFGAQHLAPEGPAPHWSAFTAALDSVELDDEAEERVAQGSLAAFARFQSLVDAHPA